MTEKLEHAGLKVVGVTCDGASTNRKFMDIHGESWFLLSLLFWLE